MPLDWLVSTAKQLARTSCTAVSSSAGARQPVAKDTRHSGAYASLSTPQPGFPRRFDPRDTACATCLSISDTVHLPA